MNISKMGRIICISCLILIVLISSVGFSYAVTSSELNQQKKDIDNKIAEINSELAGNKDKMTTALSQINKLNSEISSYESEIKGLNTQINNLNNEISVKQANIEEQEQKYKEQKELLDKRLVALYEDGGSSYLDMLLSSEGLTDFISKYYMISQIAEFDQELLESIDNTKNQIQAEKNSLDQTKNQIQDSKNAVEGKKSSLATSVNQKKSLVSDLSAEEAELQEQLEEYEEHKKEIQSQIAKLATKYPTAVAPSAAGYISPLAGKTKANITTGYGSAGYVGHTGVDFACAAGTPVLAVKGGTVVTSMAKMKNGKYVSYGEYIIIDHGDGTMTLYAHMLAGSRTVLAGQKVSQGQQIGKVGSTGNSTGNHLHFEVFANGSRTNPTQYLP